MEINKNRFPQIFGKILASLSFIISLFVVIAIIVALGIVFSVKSQNLHPGITKNWGNPGFVITPQAQQAKNFDTYAVICSATGLCLLIPFTVACLMRIYLIRRQKNKDIIHSAHRENT